MQCPEPTQLTRAHFSGDDAAIAAHAASCAQCGPEWRELEMLAGLGRELAWQRPQRDAVADMRARVVASIGTKQPVVARRRRTAMFAGFGMALAAAAALVVWLARADEPSAPAYAGAVRPLPRADFALTAPRPDERVRLFDGSIAVDVAALADGERFRVIVGDAEIEARGGSLEIVAAGDKLIAVRATRGTVEIRPQFGASVTIHAGERWEPPVVELTPPAPAVPAEPEPETDTETGTGTETETETETKPVRERVRATRRAETHDEPAAVEAPTEVAPPEVTTPTEIAPTQPATTTTVPVKPTTPPTTTAPTTPTTTPKRDRADDADQRRQDRREDQRQERRQDRREDQRQRRQERREDRRERR